MKSNKLKRYHSLQRKYLCIPYVVFLFLFVIVPIGIIIFYAFTYEYIDPTTQETYLKASGQAFLNFFTSWSKINVLFVSLYVALITTVLCLLIGFPLAYFLADKKVNKNAVLVTLFIAPMWINFVLRTGATRDLLYWMNIKGAEHPYFATLVGMVQNYLPFTILPLYTTMLKMDKSQIEASRDLGASGFTTFIKVVIPMTMPGIISAATMVFMPTMSSYVISDVMGERKLSLVGNSIQLYFDQGLWHMGSIIAVVMLLVIAFGMLITKNVDKEDRVGGNLW